MAMESSGEHWSPRIPTSVLDFQRSGGRLHFQYDITPSNRLVVDAAAELNRRLARAQDEAQSLLTELGRSQEENARLAAALAVHNKAEDQLRTALRTVQGVSRGLQTELEGTRRMLKAEQARTVSAVAAVAR
ncbi:hypothetical protein B0H12DRAFT_149101 [Mycena haematopus]|nr:hypothetical protein B0H12DRAFT_149101 [Mycena haematopus]